MSDLVHAVIDTISYCVNWICERLKRESLSAPPPAGEELVSGGLVSSLLPSAPRGLRLLLEPAHPGGGH